jgi:hypothetical protein
VTSSFLLFSDEFGEESKLIPEETAELSFFECSKIISD